MRIATPRKDWGRALTPDQGGVLVLGGSGQLGREVVRVYGEARRRLWAPSRAELDISDLDAIRRVLADGAFGGVVNCAAYTAVDRAETEAAEAFAANALAPAVLAQATREAGLPLVQVSTDYVFDGSASEPYSEHAPTAPLGVYGASKRAGELAVLAANPRAIVLRTAWVLSVHRTNFLKTMLRLAAESDGLSVVDDQIGCPTSARDIAMALATIMERLTGARATEGRKEPHGIYHFVNGGEASWADLATYVMECSRARGGPHAHVRRTTTDHYPTPARRPKNSRLSCLAVARDFGVTAQPWRQAVAGIIDELYPEYTP